MQVVGLHWGGGSHDNRASDHALACNISNVMRELNISIDSSTSATELAEAGTVISDDVSFMVQAGDALQQTPAGSLIMELVSRHEEEVRDLLRNNRRVAAAWHRNYGPKWSTL